MCPDSEELGSAMEAGVGSNLTQYRGPTHFFSEVLASVMNLVRNSLLRLVYILEL